MSNTEREEKITGLVRACTKGFKQHPGFENWQHQRIWQENFQDKVINELEKFVPDFRRKKILEVGSGMGGFLVAMKRRGCDVTGLEPRESYRKISRLRAKRYALAIDVREGWGESLPFRDASFDFIVAKDVIEHCQDPKMFLEECFRALSSGGGVYITVPNRFGFEDPHYFLRFVNWLPRSFGEIYIGLRGKRKKEGLDKQKLSNMYYFTISGFSKLAREVGFDLLNIDEAKLTDLELINSPTRKRMLSAMKIVGIGSLVYKIAHFLYLPVFQFILVKR